MGLMANHVEATESLSGEVILCFAPDPWHGLWRNRHQIMTRLARHNTVIYVEPRLYYPETLSRLWHGRLKLADFRRPLVKHYADGLWIYHDPYYAPVSGRLSGGPLTAVVRRRALLHTLEQLGIRQAPILWVVRPYFKDIIGQVGEKLVVYHVTDEYSAYAKTTDPRSVEEDERAVLQRADLVIVTSPRLLASKGRLNPHTYLVPNAVDYAGFQTALQNDSPIAALAEAGNGGTIPRPRIGYCGALNEKIDFKLLAHLARTRRDWQIVLIGSLDLASQPAKADALKGLENVHWLGRLPVTQLPPAIASFDVCLLPYEINEWTANIDSLKLYEYLACGRPIVATDVPAARAFPEVVRIGRDPDEFAAQIAGAIAEENPQAVAMRQAIAAQNTWDQRITRIEHLLIEALARKAAGT